MFSVAFILSENIGFEFHFNHLKQDMKLKKCEAVSTGLERTFVSKDLGLTYMREDYFEHGTGQIISIKISPGYTKHIKE